jgi:hypothetical protein
MLRLKIAFFTPRLSVIKKWHENLSADLNRRSYFSNNKMKFMPNSKTDEWDFSSENSDEQRDMGAKGGAATSLGRPDSKHGISRPNVEGLQTQIAAKAGKKSKKTPSKKSAK